MESKREEAIEALLLDPVGFGHLLGFTKLENLHNEWIQDMILGEEDATLQAHRGSYKTTCVSIALSIIVMCFPYEKTIFFRKTDTDVQEIIAQVKKILEHPITEILSERIWGKKIRLVVDRVNEIDTNLAANEPRGTSQLLGLGTKGSLTGKHFDRIFTDDIVNLLDRASKAEREKTKAFYQELQNIKNRGGRIYNTGTPWHKDDAFVIMPLPKKYDCYSTGLISRGEIEKLREKMTASLFAANYEMKHIASENVLFTNPKTGADPCMVEQGESHIDASYGGEDSSAFTICKKRNGFYYVLGKLRKKHIDNCEDEFIAYHNQYMSKMLSCETNGDKGYLAKDLRKKKIKIYSYSEKTNKFIKIASYLKGVWEKIVFVEGTDPEYIDQILDYNIDADHDDAPDSLASLIRKLSGKKETLEEITDQSYLQFL